MSASDSAYYLGSSGLSSLKQYWIPERGARMARRDDREYREYLRKEQRSQRGCIARRMQPGFHHGLLALPGVVHALGARELAQLIVALPGLAVGLHRLPRPDERHRIGDGDALL